MVSENFIEFFFEVGNHEKGLIDFDVNVMLLSRDRYVQLYHYPLKVIKA